MGELSEPRWTWATQNGTTRVGRVGVKGTVTPAELVEHIRAITPDVDPATIRINFATASWEREATEDELTDRQRRREHADARQERWERQTLWRLLAKYGKSGAVNPDGPVG